MAYGVNCILCNYTVFSNSLYKLLKKVLHHFVVSHAKTHKAFTIIPNNNNIQKTISNFYEKYELPIKLFKKLKTRKAPYINYISISYHKQNKHVIFVLSNIDDFDYLLMKHLINSKKSKNISLVIL